MAIVEKEVAKKVKIKILSTQDGDNSDVFIGVNSKTLNIKRGCEVEIGQEFLDVLNNSIIDTVIQDNQADGTTVLRTLTFTHYYSADVVQKSESVEV